MIGRFIVFSILLGLAIDQPLGATSATDSEQSEETDAGKWKYSLEISTYLAQNARDYANPNFSVDRDWLHLEARYNYESLKTGSVWLGYNFKLEQELKFDALPRLSGDLEFKLTPMIGGVLGDITGVAPGYAIEINYKQISFSTKGEYFVDAAIHAGNFFYSWSELSYTPPDIEWLWFGIVIDRTKVLGEEFDVRRGPLIGFKINKHTEFTAYWLAPGSREGTFVFSAVYNF